MLQRQAQPSSARARHESSPTTELCAELEGASRGAHRVSGARQRSGGVEKYSSIASRQAPEHGSTAVSPGPDSRISAAIFSAQIDADPGAEHPAARAVATRLVRCQSEALAYHASTDWKWCACAPFPRFLENAGASQSRSCAK
jgi:hypothetical protein